MRRTRTTSARRNHTRTYTLQQIRILTRHSMKISQLFEKLIKFYLSL